MGGIKKGINLQNCAKQLLGQHGGGTTLNPGALVRRPGYPASHRERAYQDEVDEVVRPRGPAVWAGQRKGRQSDASEGVKAKTFYP